jgi:four helix bundle protein
MSGVRAFTELLSWQHARAWSRSIFYETQQKAFARDQRLVVQINDSSESVMANIAEGFGRGTQNEFVLFLGYALGSLAETQSHLTAAYDRAYLSKDRYAALFREGSTIRKLTIAFIRSMVMPRGGVKTIARKVNWTNQTWEIFERVKGKPRPAIFESSRPPARLPVNDEPPV